MLVVKITVIILLTACVLLMLTGIVMGNYLYKLVINAHTDKSAFLGSKSKDKNSPFSENSNDITAWITTNAESNSIKSFDNINLNYYMVKSRTQSNKWVILCHGYNGNALRLSESAMCFYNMGFNVLIPDARGHGKSGGNYIGMGWHDRLDIINYINMVVKEDVNAQITLYGCSMGASTVLIVCGEIIPENVKVAIADCGYTSAWEELKHQLKKYLYLPSFPLLNFMSFMTKIHAGFKLEQADALSAVKKSKTPTLFIHGSKDDFVPTRMVNALYSAANCPKEKLIVKNAKHVESLTTNPKLYWDTIYDFLEKYANIN